MRIEDIQDRVTINVEEAATLLGISRGSAYQAARTGDLPGVLHIGHRYVVSVPALLRALRATRLDEE